MTGGTRQGLRKFLLSLRMEDEVVRERLAATGALFEGYHPEMQAVHDANASELAEVIAATGWPDEEMVGADGAEAAWLIAHHAIAQPDFMRTCLALLLEATANCRAPAWQAAYLEDRVRNFEGRPQIYGTQFDWDEHGVMSPLPVENLAMVDELRAGVGLPPLRWRKDVEPTEQPPDDYQARRRGYDAWRRSVGWIAE